MDEETQILIFKKKVANYCVALLIFLSVYGILQAVNQYKLLKITLELKSTINSNS